MTNNANRFQVLVDNAPQHGNYATKEQAEDAAKAARATHPSARVEVREAAASGATTVGNMDGTSATQGHGSPTEKYNEPGSAKPAS